MFPLAPFIGAVLAVLVAIAAFTDLRARRIPNWLAMAGICLGLCLNWFLYGNPGLKNAGLGFGVALIVYLPLFLIRGIGAGDVKLMAAIGSLAGPGNWLRIFIATALLGGLVAIAFILHRGAVGRALNNIGQILTSPFRGQAPYHDNPELDVTSGQAMSLPHGVVIAFATILYVFWEMS